MNSHLLVAAFNAARKTTRDIILRPAEIEILLLVWKNPGVSLSALVDELEYDRSTITKAAAYLRKNLGLIQRHTEHTYILTEEGAELCGKIEQKFFSLF